MARPHYQMIQRSLGIPLLQLLLPAMDPQLLVARVTASQAVSAAFPPALPDLPPSLVCHLDRSADAAAASRVLAL